MSGDSKTEEGRGAMAVCRYCGTIPSGDDEAVCCDRNTALKCSWLTGRERLAVIDRQLRYLESCNAQLRGGEIADLRAERDRLAASFPNYTPSPLASVEAGRGEREGLERAREHVVLAIAFLNRDHKTDRADKTVPQVVNGLVKADEILRAALSQGNEGEAVGWDFRYRYQEAGTWSRWQRADTREQAEYNGIAQTKEEGRASADIYEVRPLYAAPPSPPEGVREFAEAVLHGDDEHKAWLLEAAENYIAGKPIPPPRGKGTQSAAPGLVDAAEWHEEQMKCHERISGAPQISEYHFHKRAAEHFRTLAAKGTATANGDRG